MRSAVRLTPTRYDGIETTPTELIVGKPEPGAVRLSGLKRALFADQPPSRRCHALKNLVALPVGRPPSERIRSLAKSPRLPATSCLFQSRLLVHGERASCRAEQRVPPVALRVDVGRALPGVADVAWGRELLAHDLVPGLGLPELRPPLRHVNRHLVERVQVVEG